MTHVLVTHAPEEGARAQIVAEKLGALGYQVSQSANIYRPLSPFERRKLAAEIDKAACVLVLWSREAAEAPAVRALAERAKANGKLALARMDQSAPPMGFTGANLANWAGRDQTRAWRQLLTTIRAAAPVRASGRKSAPAAAAKSASTSAPPASEKKSGGAGLAIGLVVLLALGGAGAAAAHFVLHLF
ncbi:MAG: hypothetical protein ABUS57_04025 [Pseudomonadota bacterium]